jgi:hypothetical protein
LEVDGRFIVIGPYRKIHWCLRYAYWRLLTETGSLQAGTERGRGPK